MDYKLNYYQNDGEKRCKDINTECVFAIELLNTCKDNFQYETHRRYDTTSLLHAETIGFNIDNFLYEAHQN